MFSPSLYQQLQGKSDVCLRDPVRPVLPKAKAKAKTVKRRTAARTLAAKATAKAKAGPKAPAKNGNENSAEGQVPPPKTQKKAKK